MSFMLWGSLLGLIVLGLVILRLVVKRPALPVSPKFIYLFIASFIIGTGLVVWESNTAQHFVMLSSYPSVSGIIDKAGIAGERAIHPDIQFHYYVDSIRYDTISTLQPPMFGGKRKKYDVAHKLAEQYHPGDTIIVVYNPEHPAEAYLDIRIPWHFYVRLSFGLLLFIAGFWGFLFTTSKK